MRHRAELIAHRAPHILHMQKVLKLMNLQLSEVVTDVMGSTGEAIIRAIVAGERSPEQLAQLRNRGCKATHAEIVAALTGTWQDELPFMLKQAVELFDAYTAAIAACDVQLERYL